MTATLDLSPLPRFPCQAENKKPLTPHGFKDAVRVRDDSDWPLVGVPTGVKFDVIDIDPRNGGTAWYDANFDGLPQTRCHQTSGGGIHLLFQPAPGLRCTSGRIAPGVDVKAKGGYVIWWPREGLPFEDHPLAEWPEWLLAEAMRPKAASTVKPVAAVNRNRHPSPSVHGNDLAGELAKLDPAQFQNHDRWLRLMMSCHAAGIERQAFIEWSTSDPRYADDGAEIGRRWDSLRADGGVSAAILLTEVRRATAIQGQADDHGEAGESGGSFFQTRPTFQPRPTRNLKARLDCIQRTIERAQGQNREPELFRGACSCAEIISERRWKLTPSMATGLLLSAAHVSGLVKEVGKEAVLETITNGFRWIEEKLLEESKPGRTRK